MKTKIFISAYACEPNLGSEIGVGWNWVLEMSKYFNLWVLTRKSNKENIENWLKHNSEFNTINFMYYDLPKSLRFWKKGLRGVRTYYMIWQRLTNRIVKNTMLENDIKIYHLLTYGNASYPCSKFGQKQFFIWGPTSAGDFIPKEYSKHYTLKDRFLEILRRLSSKVLRYNNGFQSRCKNADLILCKTKLTYDHIPETYRKNAILFTDVAVNISNFNQYQKQENQLNKIKYLAVGSLVGWRGFDILIEAFSKSVKLNNNISLNILGKGSDNQRLQKLITKFKMDSYIFLKGQVSIQEYYQEMANCDVAVNPCLKEGAVTFSFDSMSFAKPLVCIDSGGHTRYFTNEYSFVIPRKSRKEVIEELSKSFIYLFDKDKRQKYGFKSREFGLKYDWNQKGKDIFNLIKKRYYGY